MIDENDLANEDEDEEEYDRQELEGDGIALIEFNDLRTILKIVMI